MNWSLFNIGGATRGQQVNFIFWFLEVLKYVIEFSSSAWSMWQLLLSALAPCSSIVLCRNVQSFISLSVLKIKAVSFAKSSNHPVISRLSSLLSPNFICPGRILFAGVELYLLWLYSQFHDIWLQGIYTGKQEVAGYGNTQILVLVN